LTLTPRAGGTAINDEGKYLVVVQRQTDGSYKVARDIDNSSMPLAPAGEASKKQP
jgi:ketosteroid isomerase-like protein